MSNRGRQGSGIIATMIFVAVSAAITGALLKAAVQQRTLSNRQVERERAIALAESGIEQAAQQISNTKGVISNPTTGSGTNDGYIYRYVIRKPSTWRFTVDSTGTVNTMKRYVKVGTLDIPTWAQYALWMNENGQIYFIGGENFYGPVHSNDKVWFAPTDGVGANFYDKMTTATNEYGGTTNGSTFAKGLQLNANQDDMALVDFAELRSNTVLSGGIILTGTTTIVFTNNNMRITNSRKGWTNRNTSVSTSTLVYVQTATSGQSNTMVADVYLSGILNGRATIIAENDINIENNLVYKDDPRYTTSDDALGLVAKDDVLITTTAPDDILIFAAMMAVGSVTNEDGSFHVIDHDLNSPRGALTVWGSIVQEVRGAVGQFNSGGPTHGYYKNYGYDTRFQIDAPPYYPRLSTKVVFTGWSEGPG